MEEETKSTIEPDGWLRIRFSEKVMDQKGIADYQVHFSFRDLSHWHPDTSGFVQVVTVAGKLYFYNKQLVTSIEVQTNSPEYAQSEEAAIKRATQVLEGGFGPS